MKIFMLMFALFSLLGFSTGCSRDDSDVIQREESLGRDDIRETDTYERSVPLNDGEDADIDRDVLGDDEVEIDD